MTQPCNNIHSIIYL